VDSVIVTTTMVDYSVVFVLLVTTTTQHATHATVIATERPQTSATKITAAVFVRRTSQGLVVIDVPPDSSTGHTAFLVDVMKLECRVIHAMLTANVTADATSRARNATSVRLVSTNIRTASIVNAMFTDHRESRVTSRQDNVIAHEHSKV
jgi:hypothetical protein